jgi:hypothetical protein
MKVKYKKDLKYSDAIEVGDQIKVAGLDCEVVRAESVFHRTPDSTLRFELKITGATPKKATAILFLPHMIPVVTLK